MILQLTTPYNPGDADPGKSYTHLHIDTLVYNSTTYMVSVVFDYGTLDTNGFYSKGAASPRVTKDTDQSDLYMFATAMSAANEPALLTAQRLAYQFLTQHCGIQGTLNTQLPNSLILQQLAAAIAAAQAAAQAPAAPSSSASGTNSASSSNSSATSTASTSTSASTPSSPDPGTSTASTTSSSTPSTDPSSSTSTPSSTASTGSTSSTSATSSSSSGNG